MGIEIIAIAFLVGLLAGYFMGYYGRKFDDEYR